MLGGVKGGCEKAFELDSGADRGKAITTNFYSSLGGHISYTSVLFQPRDFSFVKICIMSSTQPLSGSKPSAIPQLLEVQWTR